MSFEISESGYETSRSADDLGERSLTRDYAFNRQSMNDGHHTSPFDNGKIQVGDDGIEVVLVQGINEDDFKRTLSMAQRATIGVELSGEEVYADDDWEEMMQGGLQTALETQVVIFAVRGASRTATHQIVRSRRAAFHQQSQRASDMGRAPECRMPESVWRNTKVRSLWLRAIARAHHAYTAAVEADISYQDARFILPEGTTNFIMMEYPVREFLNVYAYRACSMFQWEIVSIMRQAGELLSEAHPWLEKYIKISCQDRPCSECGGPGQYWTEWSDTANADPKLRGRLREFDPRDGMALIRCHVCDGTGKEGSKCTFQGWENVEGQCPFPWAKQENRTYLPVAHKIERKG